MLNYYTNCVDSNAKFVDTQLDKAWEENKRSKWANLLIDNTEWTSFDIKKDYCTQILRNDDYLIFVHSAIEYFYKY